MAESHTSNIRLHLTNTETRVKEPLIAAKDNTVRFYTCGPTVYDYAHIGNFRTFVFEDLLRRTIRFFGMKVNQVMNLTDVDDKTIRGAIAKKIGLLEYTKPFKEAFFEDLKTLNCEQAEHYPCATDFIPEMIRAVEDLVKRKVAYVGADNSVYFAISQFPHYGRLSHLNLEELKAGASERVHQDEYSKEHISDFVLWKSYDPERDGSVYWESPFGKGRPGWHLECSVMAQKILGETIDLHAGGVDLIFPHHENEIAQAEACSGKHFSRMWVHAEHLLVENRKMSKSLGNFYTLRDLLKKGYSGSVIRFLLLSSHYRMQMNFTFQGLDAAKSSLQRINDFILRLETYKGSGASPFDITYSMKEMKRLFSEALADDLNISEALAVIFELIRQVNHLCDLGQLSSRDAQVILTVLKEIDAVLGIMTFSQDSIPEEIQRLVNERLDARKNKDWKKSDLLRDEILQKGYIVEDTPGGSRVKKA